MKNFALPARLPIFFADYASFAVFLLALGLCSFIFTAARGLQSIEQINLHNNASRQALQNTLLISDTMSLLKDIEIGEQGFVITGDDSFLVPYTTAKARIGESYTRLTANMMVAQKGNFSHGRLDELIQQRMRHAEHLIHERRGKGPDVLKAPAIYIEGKHLMDDIRSEISLLQQAQIKLSSAQTQEALEVQENSLRLIFWLSMWGTALLLVSVIFLIREKRIRDLAQEALKSTNVTLEHIVQDRTLQLRNTLQRIKQFAIELDHGVEAERRRLAREVHDQLGQIFTSLKLVMLGFNSSSNQSSRMKVEEVTKLLDEGINTARRISSELRPALLDDFGLAAAVEHYAKIFTDRGGPTMTANITHDKSLYADQANQLFRILQEASINTLRHAEASNIEVQGRFLNGAYKFCIIDDGVGPQAVRREASGIRNMQERAALIGGTLEFASTLPKGTRITVSIPMQFEESE